jgi:hypothetical protein
MGRAYNVRIRIHLLSLLRGRYFYAAAQSSHRRSHVHDRAASATCPLNYRPSWNVASPLDGRPTVDTAIYRLYERAAPQGLEL